MQIWFLEKIGLATDVYAYQLENPEPMEVSDEALQEAA
jgi:hypothetical protein